MKTLFLWYIPQAALFALGFWFATTIEPPTTGLAMVVFGGMLAAAYTGGVNLILSGLSVLRRRLRRDGSQSSSDNLSLVRPRGRPSKPPEQRERIRVGD